MEGMARGRGCRLHRGDAVTRTLSILALLAACLTAQAGLYRPGSAYTFSRWWAAKAGSGDFDLSAYCTIYRLYDAADLTAGAVSQWDDESGNGHHVVQTNAAWQPTASSTGKFPAVYFDGTADHLTNSLLTANSLTYPRVSGIVCERSLAAYTIGFGDTSFLEAYFPNWNTGNDFITRYVLGSSVVWGDFLTTGTVSTVICVTDAGGGQETGILYINGQGVATNTTSAQTAKSWRYVGRRDPYYNASPLYLLFQGGAVTDIDGLLDEINERYGL